jgi:hypothetical protein
MEKQTITINTQGGAFGLRSKKGFDLRSMGKVKTQRTTDIRMDENSQMWYFVFLTGDIQSNQYNRKLRAALLEEAARESDTYVTDETKEDYEGAEEGTFLFQDYEQAVKEEIRVVNKLRSLNGSGIV